MARRIGKRALMLGGALSALLGSCNDDPVHDDLVDSLGGEVQGVPQGEYHRAGQPCVACHGPEGPAQTQFSLAGTIFYGPTAAIGMDNVSVEFYDSRGATFVAQTNCVGNFYVTPADYTPFFPVAVQIVKGSQSAAMVSHIGREPSCSNCHADPLYFNSPGHIHMVTATVEAMMPYTPDPCPVNPILSTGQSP